MSTIDRADIVRLRVVIPGDDLSEWCRVSVLNEELPAFSPEPIVPTINEVFTGIVLDMEMS